MTKPDDDDPVSTLTGEPSPLLSREGKAMERLQGWLERRLWSGARNPVGPLRWPEGVCILAGIDPEASADANAAGWALLPGALAFYGFRSFPRDRHEAMQLGVAAEEHIGLLIGLGLKTAKPDRWIDRVQREGIVIPWQESRMRAAQSKRRRDQDEIPVLERALADAESAIVDAALTTFRSERDAEHLEVLAAVDALGFALARLLAADLAREALTGRRFTFDPARHPPADLWQPRPLVSGLVAAMPARFAPDGWAEGIERGARTIAENVLQGKGYAG